MKYAIWIIALIFFTIIEMAGVNLVSVWFCIGSLFALGAAALGLSLVWQIVIFLIVSGIGFAVFLILIKPRISRGKVGGVHTNADRIIGKEYKVIETINNVKGQGRIMTEGVDWRAQNIESDEIIEEGARVIVEELKGVTAMVKRV